MCETPMAAEQHNSDKFLIDSVSQAGGFRVKIIYISLHLKASPMKYMCCIPQIQCLIVPLMISCHHLSLCYFDASVGHGINTPVAIFSPFNSIQERVLQVLAMA